MHNIKLCSGCSACKSICPKQAITMIANKDGFLYPFINRDKCINCKLCEKICPLGKKIVPTINKVYAAKSSNKNVVLASSSGGVFYELAKYVFKNNGYVCGAAFDSNFQVHHIVIDNIEQLPQIMTSKYVQSRMEDCFSEIKNYLSTGKLVLFSGTPCQSNGLKSYLKKTYDNLICIDIICHGVPSPRIWSYELNKYKKYNKTPIKSITFRDKRISWQEYGYSCTYCDNSELYNIHQNTTYSKAFLNDLNLRKSCYCCKAKGTNRASDMTLGDFWGCDNLQISINDNNYGLSLVIIHTDKGLSLINKLNLKLEEVDEMVLNNNPSYFYSSLEYKKRNSYMNKVSEFNYDELTEKMTKKTYFDRIINKIKRIFRNLHK